MQEAVERKREAMISEREKGCRWRIYWGEGVLRKGIFGWGWSVLVPRPGDEALIELVKELDLPEEARFLEIGTGAGVLRRRWRKNFRILRLWRRTCRKRHLKRAKVNSERYGGRGKFLIRGDLLDGLPADLPRSLARDTKRGEPEFDVWWQICHTWTRTGIG